MTQCLEQCPLGRDSECNSDKYTVANCVGQCVTIEKNGRVGQEISSDRDVGKGLYEQVPCQATSEVRVDTSHTKCVGTRSQGRG